MPELDPAALIHTYGVGLVGLVIFLESMGIPLPGESLLVAAALYAATQTGLSIQSVILAAATGAILGDNAGYLIGRRLGPPALRRWGPKIGLTLPRQRLGQYLFQRHGPKLVFFGRFMAFLRTFAAVLAGAHAMPWRSFLLWNALGGVTWTTLYGLGAYLLGNQIHRLLGPFGLVTATIGLIVLLWVIRFVRRHERRLTREAEAALARQP